ncbi:MAG TPA: saccharopine dehydrogenase C-terminal domain-containing protein [Cytophagaceae bacterium]|jgi:saccharopine dehydrogenase (NADP+, L-glutamate forming)
MKNILVIGAGRSSGALIKYLLEYAEKNNTLVTVADGSMDAVQAKLNGHSSGKAVAFTLDNAILADQLVSVSNIVISLLPAHLHMTIASLCLKHKKTFLTASYVSKEIESLSSEIEKEGLLFLMEMGLDPGIDHMSAMKEIDRIKALGGKILSFKSYTGGLVAPESDDNPWHYKFSWNPRNVVLAGQGTVKYLFNGTYKLIPYHKLFSRIEKVPIDNFETFDGYANRDSLKYINTYGLSGVETFLRGTLRGEGFCEAWDIFVQLGMTDDTYTIDSSKGMTYGQFLEMFLNEDTEVSFNSRIRTTLKTSVSNETIQKIEWLNLYSERTIDIDNGTPAAILQEILEKKWAMSADDKDMVVMQHQIRYELGGNIKTLFSTLVLKGTNILETAMAKTVGLPLGIAAIKILNGEIKVRGLHIPITPEIYLPVLKELEKEGVVFQNYEVTA